MSQTDREVDLLNSRIHSINSDLSSALGAISDVESRIAHAEVFIGGLQGRLTTVRGRGYAALAYLEKNVDILGRKWVETGPLIKQAFFNNVQPIGSQIRSMQAEAQRLRVHVSLGNVAFDHSLASRLSMDASSIRARTASEAAKVSAPLNELEASANAIDRDLRIAEGTIGLFSQASFQMKPEESPILAIEGKILTGEKTGGTLYFTNQRYIFEGRKEVVLERKLFIATKKRTERIIMVEQPVGALQEIVKGRVGLIAWTGIYVRFKPSTGLAEASFDVEGWEADAITRFFSYIIGGEADRDIAQVKGASPKEAPTIQVVRCPNCYAPCTQEIYKGQTSVQCEYCGTRITIQ